MILRELILYGEEQLKNAGIDEYKNDTKILLMSILNYSYNMYLLNINSEVDELQQKLFEEAIRKRASHYPCQYIIGEQDFMGYTFHVEEGVLIPRPETEILVEKAFDITKRDEIKALDMCCGSGCIGISYTLLRKGKGYNTDMTLVDISDKAIEVSGINNCSLKAGCSIIQSDLFENIEGEFDLILSNPPYIPTADIEDLMDEVRIYEPRLALDGTDDGLYFYDKIISAAKDYLKESGIIIFEIGYNQYEDIKKLFEKDGYSGIELIKDYAGLDRIVVGRLDSKKS